MKLTIDTSAQKVVQEIDGRELAFDLYSKESFALISQLWLKVGWQEKYTYTFSWLGRPIIQLPEDMIRIQEVIYRLKPDVIFETGVAHGGSLIYYASLCRAIGKGRVIGVDIEIRPHNRQAIEAHELFSFITLVEGNSISPEIISQIKALIKPGEVVMVILDSCHTKAHVLAELEAYHDLVTPGSCLVATDGIMRELADVSRGKPEWAGDNPAAAAVEFAQKHPEFILKSPDWPFNESFLNTSLTHWPDAWLWRKQD